MFQEESKLRSATKKITSELEKEFGSIIQKINSVTDQRKM